MPARTVGLIPRAPWSSCSLVGASKRAERSEVEHHVHTDRQRVWEGLSTAGVDKVLEARPHDQARSDGASVCPFQGHLPTLHADGRVGQDLNRLRTPQVATVRAVGNAETGKI